MKSSSLWIDHFKANAREQRVNWNLSPAIVPKDIKKILPSIQAWQLGETSDGTHLLRAACFYSIKIGDSAYVEAVELFIKEEQKHGSNLGRYLDSIGAQRIKSNWGDTLFRKIRHFNTSMEIWTLAVIAVESAAQVFYQSLKEATGCTLLKQICTDILIDESYHIDFQTERCAMLFDTKSVWQKEVSSRMYRLFFFGTAATVWLAHKNVFKAGGNTFASYTRKMKYKYIKTIKKAIAHSDVKGFVPQVRYINHKL